MSGHSKWHTIKHKKGALDAKRGKLFTKLIRELTIAARLGGGDPDMNPRLRTVVEKAKAANMPADNVKRAIQKGTGDLEGVSYEDLTLEGYGPGGVAVTQSLEVLLQPPVPGDRLGSLLPLGELGHRQVVRPEGLVGIDLDAQLGTHEHWILEDQGPPGVEHDHRRSHGRRA